jgi:hypothetical protein
LPVSVPVSVLLPPVVVVDSSGIFIVLLPEVDSSSLPFVHAMRDTAIRSAIVIAKIFLAIFFLLLVLEGHFILMAIYNSPFYKMIISYHCRNVNKQSQKK